MCPLRFKPRPDKMKLDKSKETFTTIKGGVLNIIWNINWKGQEEEEDPASGPQKEHGVGGEAATELRKKLSRKRRWSVASAAAQKPEGRELPSVQPAETHTSRTRGDCPSWNRGQSGLALVPSRARQPFSGAERKPLSQGDSAEREAQKPPATGRAEATGVRQQERDRHAKGRQEADVRGQDFQAPLVPGISCVSVLLWSVGFVRTDPSSLCLQPRSLAAKRHRVTHVRGTALLAELTFSSTCRAAYCGGPTRGFPGHSLQGVWTLPYDFPKGFFQNLVDMLLHASFVLFFVVFSIQWKVHNVEILHYAGNKQRRRARKKSIENGPFVISLVRLPRLAL
ncbi:hypothetical protein CB1_000139016, partial [Camelus ferus]